MKKMNRTDLNLERISVKERGEYYEQRQDVHADHIQRNKERLKTGPYLLFCRVPDCFLPVIHLYEKPDEEEDNLPCLPKYFIHALPHFSVVIFGIAGFPNKIFLVFQFRFNRFIHE